MHFLFEKQKPDKQLAVVEKKSVFVFLVVVEIIGGSADWIRTENGGRTHGKISALLNLNLWVEKVSAGESGYGAGEHAFARIAAQRYIRAQKTRSKCRRRFTALHHHTRTPRLRFPTHNSKFRQEEKKTELYRLI